MNTEKTGGMDLRDLRDKLEHRLRDSAIAEFGDPMESEGECDNCFAKCLPVWASLNIDGDWIALCARCIDQTQQP